ncbi:MAG: hypothetical protein AAFQ82_26120, partial [Myxococcota bacterium]
NFLMGESTPEVMCDSMNRVSDPAHHLLEDPLILWAVNEIPELSEEDWVSLVERMMVDGTENVFSCVQP